MKRTLQVIENYKNRIGGNAMDLQYAALEDARDITGRNSAFVFIADQKAGNPWSVSEKKICWYIMDTAAHDLARKILDQIYSILPDELRDCRIMRDYYAR